MTSSPLNTAMVLAAGLGTRMRPITNTRPKPLVMVAGKTLLDRALDTLAEGGIERAFVNVHYLADQIEHHLQGRAEPAITISDERRELLDSGGGVNLALAGQPDGPVMILNSDSFWIDGQDNNIRRLKSAWDPDQMDMMLLVSHPEQSIGFDGAGDFFMDAQHKLTRRGKAESAPYIYAGAIVTTVGFLRSVQKAKFSLNQLFDAAIAEKRLYGCVLDGLWLHVGTPASIEEAEQAIEHYARNRPPSPSHP